MSTLKEKKKFIESEYQAILDIANMFGKEDSAYLSGIYGASVAAKFR